MIVIHEFNEVIDFVYLVVCFDDWFSVCYMSDQLGDPLD